MTSKDEELLMILPGSVGTIPGPEAIGGKAYGLARLARLGLPVPPAFVLGTACCRDFFTHGGKLPPETRANLAEGLAKLEAATGRRFGNKRQPLLVSVRSGAPISMPGMMETILNIGLCEQSLHGLLRATGNPRLAYDCYRRLIRDFTEVVYDVDAKPFNELFDRRLAQEDLSEPGELDASVLEQIAQDSLELATALSGEAFPQDPMDQLIAAVEAVFRSWKSEKACSYRRLNGIDDAICTAVTIQTMVFGNAGNNSGAGVGFTRDPASGENKPYLDFLFKAQGEDVVSGRHPVRDTEELPRRLPAVATTLAQMKSVLEGEFHDMQDFEFTVEQGRLYLLQTRDGKRAPWAALRIAVDMVQEGLIEPKEALRRLEGVPLEQIERRRIAVGAKAQPIATATSASVGVASGSIQFDIARAKALAAEGQAVILVRSDISTADIDGIAAASGVLTSFGGRTSHAAVVARHLGKVCLVGCAALHIDEKENCCTIGGERFRAGDKLTLDGESGQIYAGALPVVRERPEEELREIARWRAA